jgi:hypothetical protein
MIPQNNFMRRENFGRALLATPREPQQIKNERRVCHFPLQRERQKVGGRSIAGLK